MYRVKLKISHKIVLPGLFFLLLTSTLLRAQTEQEAGLTPEEADSMVMQQAQPVEEFDVTVGYNLKVTVRLAPVYEESSLVSPIIAHLPRGSVVMVIKEADRWYHIAFGPEDDRKSGWVISYGMERTHELEFIVTSRADVGRFEGRKVVVVSGEAAVRSFPAQRGGVLMNVYRDEVFDVSGESADYFRIVLSRSVQGWIWKGDVDEYIEPKYSSEEISEMSRSSRQQIARLKDLNDLLAELGERNEFLGRDIEKLQELWSRKVEAEAEAASKAAQPSFFDYNQLKSRSHLNFGIQRQAFGADLGLAPIMLKGLGFGFDWNDSLRIEFSYYSGSPLVRELGPEQDPLPASMDNLDTLSVSSSLLRVGLRSVVPTPKLPLLKSMDHYLFGGLGLLSLKPSAGGISGKQNLWGVVMAWGMNKQITSRMQLDISLNLFLTRAEVTDVQESGRQMLQSEKAFLFNTGFSGGVIWNF